MYTDLLTFFKSLLTVSMSFARARGHTSLPAAGELLLHKHFVGCPVETRKHNQSYLLLWS